MKVSTIKATSTTTVKMKYNSYSTFKGATAANWNITIPSYMDNVYSQVLYNQYKTLGHGNSSFAAYLNAYGANSDNYNGIIMTRYGGAQTFALNEGIWMKCQSENGFSKYFENTKWYHISTDTPSKANQKYFCIHEKVVYDKA